MIIDRYIAPAMRAAFLSGCIGYFVWVQGRAPSRPTSKKIFRHIKSQRPAIAAQSNRARDECRCKDQPNPEAGTAQIFSRSQRHRADGMSVEGERFGSKSQQTIFQHGGEIRSVERDLLKETNRE